MLRAHDAQRTAQDTEPHLAPLISRPRRRGFVRLAMWNCRITAGNQSRAA